MARNLEDGDESTENGRGLYIDALLQHRRPRSADDKQLLKVIESKTAQHRSPFSANIARRHATILSALSPEGDKPPRLGHRRALSPTREASTRKAFEVFEWEREREPLTEGELDRDHEVEDAIEGTWSEPPAPRRPALARFMAGLGSEPDEAGEDQEEEGPGKAGETPEDEDQGDEPEPAEDLEDDVDIDYEALEATLAAASTASMDEVDDVEEPPEEGAGEEEAAEDEEGAEDEEEGMARPSAPPEASEEDEEEDELVVEGRPGHRLREGGEFPEELMEQLDEAGVEATAISSRPREPEAEEAVGIVGFKHETDFSEDVDALAQETDTLEAKTGAAPHIRRPSETGLELHIDGFEHIDSQADLCPRCGRRITARNRLLTCNDCGAVACESCEMRTRAEVDAPYYYEWRFDLPLCVGCYDKALNIQKALAKADAALGLGNLTYAYYHAQQALRMDPSSPYADDARTIIERIDRRRRESAEQDEAWKRKRRRMSRTTVVRE